MEIPYSSLFLATLIVVYKNRNAYIKPPFMHKKKKKAVAINHLLIFSHSRAPLEWVIFSMPNVCYYFFSYHGLRPTQMRQTKRILSEDMKVKDGECVQGELFWSAHTRSRFSGLLLFRVVGVKTG